MLKSPMNYIGNKYRLVEQMLEIFPSKSWLLLDLFAGGLDVSINYPADKIYANDINCYLIGIYKKLQSMSYDEVMTYLRQMMKQYDLTKTNKEGYLAYRDYYNKSEERNPLDLYLLMNYSFNYQIRFNNNHEYNNPFGANRSSFNESLQSRLELFMEKLKNISFTSKDFREVSIEGIDFIYADPPYSLSIGSYNDGKRGFKGWSLQDDIDLMSYLDKANDTGILFALSNVIEHKGQSHNRLIEWSKKYNVHDMKCTYNNCNYQASNKEYVTREVLITNF